ncbi:MAG: sulfotransferase [Myxococcales bacterium]
MALTPILISGVGRSGTTALMALLGTDARVVFDRCYPFENRSLTYLVKSSLLLDRAGVGAFDQSKLVDFADNTLGPAPWVPESVPFPSSQSWLEQGWSLMSDVALRNRRDGLWYAEKVSYWLPPLIRAVMPCRTIHLVRDPRDVWLSIVEFGRRRPTVGFGVELEQLDQARMLAHQWASFAENERADASGTSSQRVRYEDMVQDLQSVAANLNAWLALALDPCKEETRGNLAQHATSASPSKSVERWKHEPLAEQVERALLAPLCADLARYGYPASHVSPAPRFTPDATWPHSGQAAGQPTNDGMQLTAVGPDLWFLVRAPSFDAAGVSEVWLCMEAGTGDHCSIYWRAPGQPFDESRGVHMPYLPGPHRQIIRLPVSSHALWSGEIEELRVDVFNGAIVPDRPGRFCWVQLVP